MIKLCYLIAIILVIYACKKSGDSDRKHPMDEPKSNDVLISGIAETYIVAVNGQLIISPKITRENNQTDSDLEFEWTIDGEIMSRSKNLDIALPTDMSSGDKIGQYNVHSVKFNKIFIKEFKLTITNPFGYGYYFISADNNGKSLLSHINIEKNSETVFHTSVIGNAEIGNSVHSLCSYAFYDKNIDQVAHKIFITSQKGATPHIVAENISLRLIETISSNHNGISFSPKNHILGHNYEKVSHFIADNSHIIYKNSVLSSKGHSNKFSTIIPGNNDKYLYAYSSSNGALYRIDTENDYTTIELSGNLSKGNIIGHRLVIFYDNGIVKERIMLLVARDRMVSLYQIESNTVTLKNSFDLPTEASCATLIDDAIWMIGAGNTIYRYDEATKSPITHFNLSKNIGKIERIASVNRGEKLIVATYDESEISTKGSISIVNQNNTIKTYPNVIYRCMGIVVCDIKSW